MNKHSLLLCLALFLTPVPANALTVKSCLIYLKKVAVSVFDHVVEGESDNLTQEDRDRLWVHEPSFQNKLEKATVKLLESTKGKSLEIPKIVEVNGNFYPVIRFLGEGAAGGDGKVFLVQTPQGPRVAKKFVNNSRMNDNLDRLRRYRTQGIPALAIIENGVDQQKNTALLEYVRGVSVYDILHNGQDLGFGFAEIETVRRKYSEHCNKFSRWPIPSSESFNVFLDIKTGQFIIIDPF